MMILHFININKNKLMIFIASMSVFWSSNIFSLQIKKFYLPQKSGIIYSNCEKDLCNIFLKRLNGRKVILLKKTLPPTIDSLSNDLTRLYFTCGSPCNYTIFYNSKKGLSQSYEFVVALDVKNEIVVVAEENQLVGYKIFKKKKKSLFKIKRNWSPTATLYSDIIEAKLIGNIFQFKYMEGGNFEEKDELIRIENF